MKPCLTVVALALALVAAGCSGDDDEEAAPGRAPPKLADDAVVKGGRPRERALLRRAVGGMEKTTLTRIAISRRNGSATNGDAAVAISFAPVPGRSVRRQWEEWVVAGAFSRRLLRAGLPAEVGAGGHAGTFTARPRMRGEPDPRPLSKRELAVLKRAIRNAATRSDAEIVRVDVHQPYGAALALVLAAENPARFLKEDLRPLLAKLEVQRPRLEGLYLAVLDEKRQLALEWGSWTRNPAGGYWVRRDLADCSPIRQTEPPGTDAPPACPV